MRYVSYQTPMMNNGMSYQGVPTIGNIGGYGYPYQNGYYNQYYNPYYIRQQQEAQRRMEIEQSRIQQDIWARLIQCRNNALGYEQVSQGEIIDSINQRVALQHQMYADAQYMNKIHEISAKAQQQLQIDSQPVQQVQTQQQQEEKSLYRWLHEDGQERLDSALNAEVKKSQRNVSNLYDSNSYQQLLSIHNNTYNSLNPNVSIDDMEIQVNLPQRLKMERDERRQRFAEALMRGY
ncbi:MAG: hypothetical protein K2P14_03440 [Anaeroplasmataceae bacterium]|nr:hypothetical protein [Anaeroplasmataceae bacterium]